MRWILRLSETHCTRWARVTSDTCRCCSLNEFQVEMISNYFCFNFLCWIYKSSDEIFHTGTPFSTTTQIVRTLNFLNTVPLAVNIKIAFPFLVSFQSNVPASKWKCTFTPGLFPLCWEVNFFVFIIRHTLKASTSFVKI